MPTKLKCRLKNFFRSFHSTGLWWVLLITAMLSNRHPIPAAWWNLFYSAKLEKIVDFPLIKYDNQQFYPNKNTCLFGLQRHVEAGREINCIMRVFAFATFDNWNMESEECSDVPVFRCRPDRKGSKLPRWLGSVTLMVYKNAVQLRHFSRSIGRECRFDVNTI